jgi:hypothetical protein
VESPGKGTRASTTDLGYSIRVTDTVTDESRSYENESGRPAPAIVDTRARHGDHGGVDSGPGRDVPALGMQGERSRKPRIFTTAAYVLLGALLSTPALPHGGGLNSAGCHNDNVNGGYHCHRDGDSEDSIDAEAPLAALVAGGLVYLIWKCSKKRSQQNDALNGSPSTRLSDVSRRDPVRLGLLPVTNSRGRVDGLGLQLRFRF